MLRNRALYVFVNNIKLNFVIRRMLMKSKMPHWLSCVKIPSNKQQDLYFLMQIFYSLAGWFYFASRKATCSGIVQSHVTILVFITNSKLHHAIFHNNFTFARIVQNILSYCISLVFLKLIFVYCFLNLN